MQPRDQTGTFSNKEESFSTIGGEFPDGGTRGTRRGSNSPKGYAESLVAPLRDHQALQEQRLIGILTQFQLPQNFYLDIPSARIPLIRLPPQAGACQQHHRGAIPAASERAEPQPDLRLQHPSDHRNRTLDIYRLRMTRASGRKGPGGTGARIVSQLTRLQKPLASRKHQANCVDRESKERCRRRRQFQIATASARFIASQIDHPLAYSQANVVGAVHPGPHSCACPQESSRQVLGLKERFPRRRRGACWILCDEHRDESPRGCGPSPRFHKTVKIASGGPASLRCSGRTSPVPSFLCLSQESSQTKSLAGKVFRAQTRRCSHPCDE